MIREAGATRTALITGGAGFIGSHVADELLSRGYRVRVLDSLIDQVHGSARRRPAYLSRDVELIQGDVRDPDAVRRALRGCDAVFHFAARVGVGQSMYDVARYTSVNNEGTATLLEALIERPVQRLIVASSMSIYGEGLYRVAQDHQLAKRNGHAVSNGFSRSNGLGLSNGRLGSNGHAMSNGHTNGHGNGHGQGATNINIYGDISRSAAQMRAHQWQPTGPAGEPLEPLPTPETKSPNLASVYALSKYDQERMCLIVGQAYRIPVVALRFFNVYGPRQALSNPYTGVLAIFASRLINDRPPLIFEDGLQQRDFVSVHDVARACRQALEAADVSPGVFNIGSGEHFTVREIASALAKVLGKGHIEPHITGDYRAGDIRHCFADITRATRVLGYQPRVTLEQGMKELARWLDGQAADDHVEQARAELATRGLTV